MEFGIINIFNLIEVSILFIINIIFSLKLKNKFKFNSITSLFDSITCKCSIVLLIIPFGINKFSFGSVEEMLIYLFYNIAFILIYIIIWFLYKQQKRAKQEFILTLIPFMIFLLNGIILKHLLLIISSILFGISHIYIVFKRHTTTI